MIQQMSHTNDVMDTPIDATRNQVVETTPGHSQKLFTTSGTANLREQVKAHTKGTTGNTMMEKSLLWVPC